jgi:hypothetical protein
MQKRYHKRYPPKVKDPVKHWWDRFANLFQFLLVIVTIMSLWISYNFSSRALDHTIKLDRRRDSIDSLRNAVIDLRYRKDTLNQNSNSLRQEERNIRQDKLNKAQYLVAKKQADIAKTELSRQEALYKIQQVEDQPMFHILGYRKEQSPGKNFNNYWDLRILCQNIGHRNARVDWGELYVYIKELNLKVAYKIIQNQDLNPTLAATFISTINKDIFENDEVYFCLRVYYYDYSIKKQRHSDSFFLLDKNDQTRVYGAQRDIKLLLLNELDYFKLHPKEFIVVQ